MKDFLFKSPTRVHFGVGSIAKLGSIVRELGAKKAFVLTGSVVAKSPILTTVKESLDADGTPYITFAVPSGEPSVPSVDALADELKASGADVIVSVGGGGSIDLAKAAAALVTNEGSVKDYLFGGTKTVTNKPIFHIAIPTTAGTGSEVTAATVVDDPEKNVKLSISHEYIIPNVALIDPNLHLDMPAKVTAMTGFDALTHAIESYVSLNASPVSDTLGIAAIKMIGANLATAVHNGKDIEARSNMAVASTIAGIAFMNGGLGVVHGIAQSMGGLHHTPHGIANGLLLPYAMHRNYVGNPEKFANIAEALGKDIHGLSVEDAAKLSVDAVFDLQKDVGIPTTLGEVDVYEKDFDPIIAGTMGYRLLPLNPVKLSEEDVRGILLHAAKGR